LARAGRGLVVVIAVAALLTGAGPLAAQDRDGKHLTEEQAEAILNAAGGRGRNEMPKTSPGPLETRVFQLKAADPERVVTLLKQAFARRVEAVFDDNTGSIVVRGAPDAIQAVTDVVRTVDGEAERAKKHGADSASPITLKLAGGDKVVIDSKGYHFQPGPAKDRGSANLRPIRVAVFDFDVLKGVDMEPAALTDQVNTMLAAMDKVTIVNRDQIKKVADEHKMALAGLVDSASAAHLGKFLSANYVIVGRASKIGQTNYLVLKIIDVGTTVQTTVSAKAAAEAGLEALLERLKGDLAPRVCELQKPQATEEDPALAKVRAAAKPLADKVILVDISETHVNRPLVDPAAQMAVANRLKAIGIEVIVPKEPVDGWKKSLLETGRYGERKVDFLLEGEGTSAYAAEMQGMISCRARVELRLIAVPGRNVTVNDKGVAARVDLVEALAAKAALEDAGANALDAVIIQHAKAREENK
jgi:hypothetical protein